METMYQPCEKCRTEGNQWPGGLPVTLIGGYHTKLCDRHANEWHEFMIRTGEFRGYQRARVSLSCAIGKSDYDIAVEENNEVMDYEAALFRIAKAWCQEPAPVPEEADKPAPRLAVLTYHQATGPVTEVEAEPQLLIEMAWVKGKLDALNYEDPASLDAEPEPGDSREAL